MAAIHQAFPFWNALTELQQAAMLDYTIIRHCAPGESLKKRAGLYIVGDGSIALYSSHESGRRRVVFSAHWMECLLLTPAFLADSSTLSLELFAREVSEIWFIPYEEWQEAEEWLPEIRDYTVELMSSQMSSLIFGVSARMEKNISKRLALFLHRFYERSRAHNGDTLHISHEELAEQVGTTREAVTRNVNILKDAGLVQTGRGKIRIIDPDALQAYANTESKFDEEE
ncbi:MAG: Crp/Fnr family transcriptional regulator [Lachnospiraceae bacterium]|nr:Crp/Fnr family transcriptional regulator [Lachnospiraceae bacterium]